MADRKREEPAPVEPLTLGGVRYEAPMLGGAVGAAQDGGVLAAYDAASGALLWTLVVYENPERDEDPEVYITSIRAAADGRTLCIVNEHGEEFRVDPETHAVARVSIADR